MKVLIVEKNAGKRRILLRALPEHLEAVHECSEGAEALAAYKAFRPDVVLTDVCVGEMDGLALTRAILACDMQADIFIVTGFDDDALREAARLAGARAYLLSENLAGLEDVIVSMTRKVSLE